MRIKSVSFKNFGSYGNKDQTVEFSNETGNFYLVVGNNGAGKCLDKHTQIEITFSDEKQKERFEKFIKERRC